MRAYCGLFGIPQIFMTINPCPVHSPIFQVMVGDRTVDLSARFPVMPSAKTRAVRLAKDPVAAADFFDMSIRMLFSELLGWDFGAPDPQTLSPALEAVPRLSYLTTTVLTQSILLVSTLAALKSTFTRSLTENRAGLLTFTNAHTPIHRR